MLGLTPRPLHLQLEPRPRCLLPPGGLSSVGCSLSRPQGSTRGPVPRHNGRSEGSPRGRLRSAAGWPHVWKRGGPSCPGRETTGPAGARRGFTGVRVCVRLHVRVHAGVCAGACVNTCVPRRARVRPGGDEMAQACAPAPNLCFPAAPPARAWRWRGISLRHSGPSHSVLSRGLWDRPPGAR